LCIPDRDDVQGLEERLQNRRDSDRFRRPDRKLEQDVQAHRSRSRVDGMEAQVVGNARQAVIESAHSFYKMSGSGNDFIFFDLSEGSADGLENPATIRAISARGTGVGADGVVFLEPDSDDRFTIRYY